MAARRQGAARVATVVVRAALALLGANFAWGALNTFAAPFVSNKASRGSRTTLKASADEDGLMSAINNGNRDRIARAVEAMPQAPSDAFKKLEGEWQVKWDSNTMGPTQKTMLKFMCPQLPSVMVEFYRQYNHISDGTYRWIQAFTMPGFERTNAALLMQGPIKKGKKGSTATVTLDTVQLVASNAGTSESKEAMRSLGLDRYMKPQKLKDTEAMTIEIAYMSDEAQVQVDEVGSKYVMSKMSESYGTPYVYGEKKSTY